MSDASMWIAGPGATTAVGRNAESTAAAVRAGITGFVDHPYLMSLAGEPMQAAIAPWLDIELAGNDRLMALLCPAIDQTIAPLDPAGAGSLRLGLSLGLPAPRPGMGMDPQTALRREIAARYPGIFTAVATFPIGHAAGLRALEAAAAEIARGRFDACIVAGVDSYIGTETLEWLEEHDQLHGGGLRKYAWGFIPGEAAGAVLLAGAAVIGRFGLVPVGRLCGIGTAFEPKAMKTATVCIGEGLTAALRGALRGLPDGAKITDLYCDMNGEPYRADEYGFATLRVVDRYDDDFSCQTPADCIGDIGAASGILFAILAGIGSSKGYSRGCFALIFCGSEAGERGSVLLEALTQEG